MDKYIKLALIIIIFITSYFVLISGYNAFISYTRRIREDGFVGDAPNQGKCTTHEYADYTIRCVYDLKGPSGTKPISPQLSTLNAMLRLPTPQGPTPTEANEALIDLLDYINKNRYDPSLFRFRNMIKCLFFTCSSNVKAIDEMGEFISKTPLIFTRATLRTARTVGTNSPASLLKTILSYLDTRRTIEDEPLFFETIRDIFMERESSSLRTDIPFGQLLNRVDPEHIFR
jgi:hypothetical protein